MNKYIKSSFLYTIATFFGQGLTFLGMLIFVRLMSQNEYGLYSDYYSYVSIFNVVSGINLQISLDNAYIDYENEIYEYRKSILFFSTIVCLFFSFLCLFILSILNINLDFFLFIFCVLHAYAFFVVNYYTQSANMECNYIRKSCLLIIPYLLQFLLALIFILTIKNYQFQARVIGSCVGVLACAVYSYIKIMSSKGKLINSRYIKYALKISMPSIIMSLSAMVIQNIDKVIITDLCSAEDTAIYSVLYYFGFSLILLENAIGSVRQVWLYRGLANNNVQNSRKIQKYYLYLLSFVIIFIFLISPNVIRLILPKEYYRCEYISPIVISSAIYIINNFFTQFLSYKKQNLKISFAYFIAALLNIILNYYFIPKIGPIFAAYSLILTYLIMLIISSFFTVKDAKKYYSIKEFIFFITFIVFNAFVFNKVIDSNKYRVIIFGIELLIVSYILYTKKKDVMSLIYKSENDFE